MRGKRGADATLGSFFRPTRIRDVQKRGKWSKLVECYRTFTKLQLTLVFNWPTLDVQLIISCN
jgi:hypothetical protein